MTTMNDSLTTTDEIVQTAAAIHPQVAAASLQDCELILLADCGEALVLNASAALIWHGIEDGDDVAALADRLTSHYAVAPEIACEDVTAFLSTLAEAGAIVMS
jgi:hypothetical protein